MVQNLDGLWASRAQICGSVGTCPGDGTADLPEDTLGISPQAQAAPARCSVLSFSGWRSPERWLGRRESGQIPGIWAGFLGSGPFHAERGLVERERGPGDAERGLDGREPGLAGRERGLADWNTAWHPGSGGGRNGSAGWTNGSGELMLGARSG